MEGSGEGKRYRWKEGTDLRYKNYYREDRVVRREGRGDTGVIYVSIGGGTEQNGIAREMGEKKKELRILFFTSFFTGGKLQLTYTGLPVDGCRGGVESKVVFYFDCGNHVGQPSLSRYVVRIEDYNIYLSGKGLPAVGFTQKLTVNERKHHIQKKAIDP